MPRLECRNYCASNGAFLFLDIYFYSTNTITYFSCEYGIKYLAKPLFTEACITVITIEIGNRQNQPIATFFLVCFVKRNHVINHFKWDTMQSKRK